MFGAALLSGCGSSPPPTPVAYSTYVSGGETFQIDYPTDWLADGDAKRGLEWAEFSSGSNHVEVKTDVSGSLLGDIANSGAAGADPNDEIEPVDKVHAIGEEEAKDDLDGYEEQGVPSKLDQPLGPGRVSEFTMPTAFGSVQRGLRATVLAHNKRVVVYCTCDDDDWATIKPAFERMLSSLDRAGAASQEVVTTDPSSPEEVYQKHLDALRADGILGGLRYATPRSQAAAAYGAVVGMLGTADGDDLPSEFVEFFERHGLDRGDAIFTQPQTNLLATLNDFSAVVDDPLALLEDLLKTTDELSGGVISEQTSQLEDILAPENVHLHDVQIDGDTAIGMSDLKIDGTVVSSAVAFKKINGEWRVDLPPEVTGEGSQVASTSEGGATSSGAEESSDEAADDPFADNSGFGDASQPDQGAAARELPEEIADWKPDDYRAAFKTKDERLTEAVSQLAAKTVGDEDAVKLFVELLVVPEKKEDAQSEPSEYGGGYGGSYGSGGGGYTDPQLGPALIAALGRNGTRPARETLTGMLRGEVKAITQDQTALAHVVTALANNPSPENEDLLFAAATTPTEIRKETEGILAPDRMQDEVFKALGSSASAGLRRRMAEFVLAGGAADATGQSIMKIVMAEEPNNLGAQIVLFGSSTTDAQTRDKLLGYFIEYGNATINDLLGIPVDFQLDDIPDAPKAAVGTYARRSGSGYGDPSDRTAYGAQDTAAAKAASQEARGRIAGAPVPSGEGEFGNDDSGSGKDGSADDIFGEEPYAVDAGDSSGDASPEGSEPVGRDSAADAESMLYYHVASYLWRPDFVDTLKLDALDKAAVSEGAQILRLATTMPLDAVRREVAKLVDQNWDMGANRMRSSQGPWGVDLKDPGALVIVKSQPRKMDPEVRRERRASDDDKSKSGLGGKPAPQRRPPKDKKEREERARYEWMEATEQFVRVWNQRFLAAARFGRHGQVGRVLPVTPGAGSPFQYVAARLNQAPAQAEAGAAADPFGTQAEKNAAVAATQPPVELHEGAKVVAEYHLNWPADLEGKMPGAADVSPLIVHYLRIEEPNRVSTLSKFYSDQLKGSRGNFLPDGRWLDFSDAGSAPGRKRTIDIMLTIPVVAEAAEEDDAPKAENAVQGVVVEILSIEINDPMGAEGA
jgi:hypothetical protein